MVLVPFTALGFTHTSMLKLLLVTGLGYILTSPSLNSSIFVILKISGEANPFLLKGFIKNKLFESDKLIKSSFDKYGNRLGEKCSPYIMPEENTINIDEPRDFELAEFFQQIKSTKYYSNTVFIILPDHSELRNHIMAPNDYQIPLLIHAPQIFQT